MNNNTMYTLVKSTLEKVVDRHTISYYKKIYNNDFFLDRVDRLAYWLHSQGIQKGDVVAICLPNIPDAIFSVYAVNKCGAIANLIHPLMPPLGLKKLLDFTDTKLLIYLDSFYVKGMDILKDIKTIICNVSDYMSMPISLFAWHKTKKDNRKSLNATNTISIKECYRKKGEINIKINEEDIAAYLHSGGTTGSPKTIMLSNRSLNACAKQTGAIVGDIYGNSDAMLMALPLFHGFGLGVAMHTTICKGAKVVLMPRFSGKGAAKLIKKEGITFIAGVPQMYNKIMDAKEFSGNHLKKLKNIYCGGDKLPKSIKDRWDKIMQKWGNEIEILEGYGLTEMVTVSHVNIPNVNKPSSVGKPLKGIMQKIIDNKGNILKPNQSGEICLSGKTMMSGYLKDPKSTKISMRKDENGINWIHTGDCGYIDEDGFLFFRERIKRMIKVSGINVFPQEIEYTVSSLPEIKYACALEIEWNKKPAIKLYVVLNNKFILDKELENKILNHISERLMKYSMPKVIEQRDKLPLTMVGKVDFMALKRQEEVAGKLIY